MDQIVAHAVSIQPVLPLPIPERPTLAQRYPQIYQDLVATKGPSPPQWTRIAEAHKERWVPLQPQHAAQQDEEDASFLAVPAAPWTCFAVRQDDANYFGVGDAAGQVLLYCRHPRAVCLQTVRTAAAQREAERPIAWSDTKHYTSTTTTTTKAAAALYPNAVTAVCWQGAVCVVWTKREVQVLNVVHHTTLALVPLNDKGMPTTHPLAAATTTTATGTKRHSQQQQALNFQALDLHPTQSLLLWRPLRCRPTEVPPPTTSNATFSHEYHSLFCIDFTEEPVTHTAVAPADSVSHCWCHAAVWDRQSPTHILTVLSQSSEDVSSSSWETWLCRMTVQGNVAQRTALPEAGRHVYTDCVLEQYHDFLFLCTGRGIRCYETNRLTFLTVYGETVALHNQTVAWQACFWIPEPGFDAGEVVLGSSSSSNSTGGGTSLSKNHRQATSCWIHRSDELATTTTSSQQQQQARTGGLRRWESTSSAHSHSTTSSAGMPASHPSTNQNNNTNGNKLFSNMLLVGVPHPTRGPTELQSTLYVWKPGQVLPLTTLQAPPGGLLGLHIMATPGRGWNLVGATAHSGQGWQWSATVQSEFAGTPYPVGYQLVTESVEYVEDETELDHNVWVAQPPQQPTSPTTKQEDSDLQKALQQSLQQQEQEPLISVLCSDDENDDTMVVRVPSVPEPSLREVFDTQAAAAAVSPGRRRPPHSQRRVRSTPQALTLFPQCSKAMQEQQEHQPKPPPQQPQQVVATSQQQQHRTVASEPPPTLKGKGKRSRIATVEALLLSAVNPVLKEKMSLVHKEWKSTTTCRAPQNDETTTVFRCAACQGRMVVHTCGKRELPVDTEALERAEKLRQEQEAAEQKRLRAERRRLAEAKRRESRRKKKELEDRRLYAQRMEEERRIRATLEQEEQDRQHQAEQQRQAAVLRLVAAAAPPMVASSSSPRVVVEPVSQQRLAVAAEYSHYQQQQQQQLPTAAAAASVVSSSSSNSTTAAARPSIPKFSELRNCHSASTTLSSSSSSSQQTQGYSSSSTPHGFYATAATPASEPVFAATTTTTTDAPPTASSATTTATGAYYQQSESTAEAAHAAAAMANARRDLTTTFTASDRDALAALVGLAESLAPQRPSNNTTPTTTSHYDYSGSSDRRSAILAQYSSWKPPTVTYEHPTTTTNTESSSVSAAPNAVRLVPHHHQQQEGASTPTTTTTTSRSVSEGASKEAVSAAYSAFGTTPSTQPSLWTRGSSATTTTDPADATTTTPWNATTTTTTNGVDSSKEY